MAQALHMAENVRERVSEEEWQFLEKFYKYKRS